MTAVDTELAPAAPRLRRGRPRRHRPPRGAARRPDRADGARPRRVRRRRRVPPRRPGRRAPHRRRGQRDLLPGPRRGPRPGRGLPVHDADLRRGRRVRRLARASAARRSTTRPCATSSCAATPRRSPPRSTHGRPSRATSGEIDLLDWFAELTIYTSSACLIGTRFREQLDGRFADALPRPRAGHRRHRLRRPLRRHRELPRARRGPRRPGRAGAGDHGRPRRRAAARRRTTATCSTCSCRSRTRTASLHFSADIITGMFISMMFAGHHTTSGTAAWTLIELLRHPDVHGRGGRRARRARTPRAPRSATRRCARCRSSRPPSRRRCACTRR